MVGTNRIEDFHRKGKEASFLTVSTGFYSDPRDLLVVILLKLGFESALK
jgi:hypothetical protein